MTAETPTAAELFATVSDSAVIGLIDNLGKSATDTGADVKAILGAVVADEPRLVISWEYPSDEELLEAAFSFEGTIEADSDANEESK